MKIIPLIPFDAGRFAFVDDYYYDALLEIPWRYCAQGYAVVYIRKCDKNKVIFMHRIVNKTLPGHDTDHKNGNRLDNRRDNLRTCTPSQNAMNRKMDNNNSTGFRGVKKINRHLQRPYEAAIVANGQYRFLGLFSTAEEAHCAYVEAARQMHGEFCSV